MPITLDGIRDIRLYQRKDGYRFSLDAVVLYSFVNMKRARAIADLGAGSGVVGLLLARKYGEARVTLLELQKGLHELAGKNIALNGLQDRVRAICCDIRKMPGGLTGFDLVVCNPPFRKPRTGLLSEGEERAVARHELKMDLGSLLSAASGMLRHGGRFFLIHHPGRLAELLEGLRGVRLEPKRLRFVHGRRDLEAKMVLLEAARGGRPGVKVDNPLFVHDGEGGYTGELREIFGQ
jgi:tRNA1Val (adenine37-N6)-methyltransferase